MCFQGSQSRKIELIVRSSYSFFALFSLPILCAGSLFLFRGDQAQFYILVSHFLEEVYQATLYLLLELRNFNLARLWKKVPLIW